MDLPLDSVTLAWMPLGQVISAGRVVAIVLWGGVAAVALAVLILMLTRWGQVRPLSKCMILSLFLHALFFVYAHSTTLFLLAPAAGPGESPVKVRLETPRETRSATPAQPAADAAWNRFAAELPPPAVSPPDIAQLAADDPKPTRRVDRELPEAGTLLSELDIEPTAAQVPDTAQVSAAAVAAAPAPVEAAVPPVAASVEGVVAADPVPPATSPERLADARFVEGSARQPGPEVPVTSPPAPDALAAGGLVDVREAVVRSGGLSDSATIPTAGADGSPVPGPMAGAAAGLMGHSALVVDPAVAAAIRAAPRRPADGQAVPLPYVNRLGGELEQKAARFGGTPQTQLAVERAQAWLASSQSPEGRWDPAQWGAGQETRVLGHDRQGAGARADTGVTALALLVFLGAGQTHYEGKNREQVQHGLEFLVSQQAANGDLAGAAELYARMYCHGMAMLALSEAYVMTGDERLRPYLERAVQYSVRSQHPSLGGWRYQPHDLGDMSQFGWQVMALKSAELAGISMPAATRDGMLRFVRRSAAGRRGGLAGYRPGESPSPTMTAEAMVCRSFLGVAVDPAAEDEATTYVLSHLPRSGETPNLYYWYYGTLAMFQRQGDAWNRWNAAMQPRVLELQVVDGALAGSWDPDTVWGSYGGRVYSTAMAALCLEVYYRYLPLIRAHADSRPAK